MECVCEVVGVGFLFVGECGYDFFCGFVVGYECVEDYVG